MQQFSFEPKILLQKLKYNSTTGMSKFEKYPFLEFLGCFFIYIFDFYMFVSVKLFQLYSII